ncbi:MAG: adenine deaminase C-terminal domain-containing protein [Campylobacterota bacterium]|nr:adenine deaminase C-terminal domain-containing protein [Campylobacterota bacterium]
MMAKIEYAKAIGKPIDGHAPGLQGDDLSTYINAGITTDHEAYSYEEGLEKIAKGMKILIREGSAAKNYEALSRLIDEYPNSCMFCSDDKHPDDLVQGHINSLVKRSIELGYDLFNILQVACINPIEHYNLDIGKLQVGDRADFIIVDNLREFNLIESYIDGACVFRDNQLLVGSVASQAINNFNAPFKDMDDFKLPFQEGLIRVIKAIEHELITKEVDEEPKVEDRYVVADVERDILKIAVVNRYRDAEVVVDFIEGFGLQQGAIASSIAHDSHNIIAIGCDDESIAKAVNLVIENQGAIVAVGDDEELILPLDIAGLMSSQEGERVAKKYKLINKFVKDSLGSRLDAPFMTLSFMALLVIPELKLSDKGLFDSQHFAFTDIFCAKI